MSVMKKPELSVCVTTMRWRRSVAAGASGVTRPRMVTRSPSSGVRALRPCTSTMLGSSKNIGSLVPTAYEPARSVSSLAAAQPRSAGKSTKPSPSSSRPLAHAGGGLRRGSTGE